MVADGKWLAKIGFPTPTIWPLAQESMASRGWPRLQRYHGKERRLGHSLVGSMLVVLRGSRRASSVMFVRPKSLIQEVLGCAGTACTQCLRVFADGPKTFLKNLLPRISSLLVSAPRKPAGVAKAAGENRAKQRERKSFKILVDHVRPPANLHVPQKSGPAKKQGVLHFRDFKLNSILSRQRKVRNSTQVGRTKH